MNEKTDTQINQLRNTISKMELVFNAIDEAVVWANQKGDIQWCNEIFNVLTGRSHIELLGKNILEILDIMNIKPIEEKKDAVNLLSINEHGWIINEFTSINKKKNEKFFFQISIRVFGTEKIDKSFIIIIRDITRQKKLENQLEHLAHYDLLTNLPNRLQFQSFLERELVKSKRHNRKFSIFFIDVDGFKAINDTYGHKIGDQFLRALSERLVSVVREEDFVARIGGDEFIVIASEIENYAISEQIAEKITKKLNTIYVLSGNKIEGHVSIGIAHFPKDGQKADHIIHVADLRMYQEKNSSK